MAYCLPTTTMLAITILLLLLLATGANGRYVLELVQVAHRGGITPPPESAPNREKMCSPKGLNTCAAIANRGAEQVMAMGNYIMGVYKRDVAVEGSSTWFGQQYDPAIVGTHSSADALTTQAAKELLKGIYGLASLLNTPAAESTPLDDNTPLNAEAYEYLILTNKVNGAALNKTLELVVDKQFPDFSVVQAMGKEVGLDALCSEQSNRVFCCYELQQLATIYAVMGEADAAPSVMANKPKLDAIAAARFHELYGYDSSVPSKKIRGTLGQPLIHELLCNMRQKMLTNNYKNHNVKSVLVYAHHVPIRTILGYMPSDEIPPVETFLVDLLSDSATGAFFVRLRYATAGFDGVGAGFADFPFRCLGVDGASTGVNTTGGIICRFDDFKRFVETSEGRSGRSGVSACYFDEDSGARLSQKEGVKLFFQASTANHAENTPITANSATNSTVILTKTVVGGLSAAFVLLVFMFAILCYEMFFFFFPAYIDKSS